MGEHEPSAAGMTISMTAPAGFPGPGEPTGYRELMTGIVDGRLPPPAYLTRWRLPLPDSWSHGTVSGVAEPGPDDTWTRGVVFGGYAACLVDQFAGLAMLTVLPDAASFLTARIELDMRAPLRPGRVRVTGRVARLTRREATVEVTLDQDACVTALAAVNQIVRWRSA